MHITEHQSSKTAVPEVKNDIAIVSGPSYPSILNRHGQTGIHRFIDDILFTIFLFQNLNISYTEFLLTFTLKMFFFIFLLFI